MLINAENLLRDIIETYEYEFPTASGGFDEFVKNILPNIVKHQPTIDAVPVVRCKDCIHYDDGIKGLTVCFVTGFEIEKNDFCSKGRKEI